jgi:hypothetical protein
MGSTPGIKTLLELERKRFGYVDTPKPTLETESRKSPAGLGIITPDPMVKMLGPGYMRFASPFGIKGAARESANRVDLLAVVSDEEGTGHFQAFIITARQTMTPFVFGRFGIPPSATFFAATEEAAVIAQMHPRIDGQIGLPRPSARRGQRVRYRRRDIERFARNGGSHRAKPGRKSDLERASA